MDYLLQEGCFEKHMEWQYVNCRISSEHFSFYVCVRLHFNPSSSTSFQLHNYSLYFTNSPIIFSLHPVLHFHRWEAGQQLDNPWRAASGLSPEVGTSCLCPSVS